MTISEKLKEVQFKGFPELEWDKVFACLSIAYECQPNDSTLNLIKRVVFLPFYNKYNKYILQKNHNSKVLYFQSEANRKSTKEQFKVISTLVEGDTINPTETVKYKIDLLEGAKLLTWYIPYWLFCLNQSSISIKPKLIIIDYLIRIWYLKKIIQNIDIKQYKLLITFYDSLCLESFLTLLFKKENKTTATLQHGQFSAFRENELINSGIEFRSSPSDYMLCWNHFTVDEALKQGLKAEKLIICGIIGYINTPLECCTIPNNCTFGVVLGHPAFEEENQSLIKAANILATKTGKKYFLKLHPNYREDHFKAIINKEVYIGNITKGIDIKEYANSVDFSIVGSSSVFIELVFIKHNTLRYSSQNIKDKFRDIKIGRIFHTPTSILEAYEKEDAKDLNLLFDYLCTVKNIREKYKYFIESHI